MVGGYSSHHQRQGKCWQVLPVESKPGALKMKLNARLFHNCVGGEAGFYFGVHRKVPAGDAAKPDAVVALAMPHEGTVVFPQQLDDLFLE
jgi:hypothetical protein